MGGQWWKTAFIPALHANVFVKLRELRSGVWSGQGWAVRGEEKGGSTLHSGKREDMTREEGQAEVTIRQPRQSMWNVAKHLVFSGVEWHGLLSTQQIFLRNVENQKKKVWRFGSTVCLCFCRQLASDLRMVYKMHSPCTLVPGTW